MSDELTPATADARLAAVYPYGPVHPGWKLLAQFRFREPDKTLKDYAERIGYSAQSIGIWLKKPAYQAYENWVFTAALGPVPVTAPVTRQALESALVQDAADAKDRIVELAETTKNERLQFDAARDILDRAGVRAPKKQVSTKVHVHLTPELLASVRQRLVEADQPVVEGQVVP